MTVLVFALVLVALSAVAALFVPRVMRAQGLRFERWEAWCKSGGVVMARNVLGGFDIHTTKHLAPGTLIVMGQDPYGLIQGFTETVPLHAEPVVTDHDRWIRQYRMEQALVARIQQPDPKAIVKITGI